MQTQLSLSTVNKFRWICDEAEREDEANWSRVGFDKRREVYVQHWLRLEKIDSYFVRLSELQLLTNKHILYSPFAILFQLGL